jgi:hypothetical protein
MTHLRTAGLDGSIQEANSASNTDFLHSHSATPVSSSMCSNMTTVGPNPVPIASITVSHHLSLNTIKTKTSKPSTWHLFLSIFIAQMLIKEDNNVCPVGPFTKVHSTTSARDHTPLHTSHHYARSKEHFTAVSSRNKHLTVLVHQSFLSTQFSKISCEGSMPCFFACRRCERLLGFSGTIHPH